MDFALQQLLADLERDTGADVAQAFATLVVDYFAETRSGLGRVSARVSGRRLRRRSWRSYANWLKASDLPMHAPHPRR